MMRSIESSWVCGLAPSGEDVLRVEPALFMRYGPESGGLASLLLREEAAPGDENGVGPETGAEVPVFPNGARFKGSLGSNDCGIGTFKAVRTWLTGDFGKRESFGGEPNCEVGGELTAESPG